MSRHPTTTAIFMLNNGTLPKPDSNTCTILHICQHFKGGDVIQCFQWLKKMN